MLKRAASLSQSGNAKKKKKKTRWRHPSPKWALSISWRHIWAAVSPASAFKDLKQRFIAYFDRHFFHQQSLLILFSQPLAVISAVWSIYTFDPLRAAAITDMPELAIATRLACGLAASAKQWHLTWGLWEMGNKRNSRTSMYTICLNKGKAGFVVICIIINISGR